jgi:hypothetical protein
MFNSACWSIKFTIWKLRIILITLHYTILHIIRHFLWVKYHYGVWSLTLLYVKSPSLGSALLDFQVMLLLKLVMHPSISTRYICFHYSHKTVNAYFDWHWVWRNHGDRYRQKLHFNKITVSMWFLQTRHNSELALQQILNFKFLVFMIPIIENCATNYLENRETNFNICS